jgi:8-oxo-dGTP pyrophosphatase MutT (NUDIX family)
MRTIHRDIVGGFIFSKDGKFLLGKNRSGGVYEGSFVVPGGGVDDGETKLEALKREMLEETGIDINDADVSKLNEASGQHEKTLRETGERVFVKMDFFNYKITIPNNSSDINLLTEDDWNEPQWFTLNELANLQLSPPTKQTLIETGLIAC